MERWVIGGAAALAVVLTLAALRRPLSALWRLMLRSGAGLCCLWLFNQVGGHAGMRVGVNALTGLVLGALGAPGFGLLLLAQWALR